VGHQHVGLLAHRLVAAGHAQVPAVDVLGRHGRPQKPGGVRLSADPSSSAMPSGVICPVEGSISMIVGELAPVTGCFSVTPMSRLPRFRTALIRVSNAAPVRPMRSVSAESLMLWTRSGRCVVVT